MTATCRHVIRRKYMKTQFDDFQKMNLKKTCKAIEEMTYTYVNPETHQPTQVPAKHYEKILGQSVEQFLDETIKIAMLNNVYNQLIFLEKEYGKDLKKALLCYDMGIKPEAMSLIQSIALDETYLYMEECHEKEKKNFHLLNSKFVEKFKEVENDKELHVQILRTYEDKTIDENEEEIDQLELN